MQRRYIYGRRSRTRITEPGPGQWHIAPAVTRPVRTAPGAPSHADGLRKKSRTVTAGQGCPRRRSEPLPGLVKSPRRLGLRHFLSTRLLARAVWQKIVSDGGEGARTR